METQEEHIAERARFYESWLASDATQLLIRTAKAENNEAMSILLKTCFESAFSIGAVLSGMTILGEIVKKGS